ncbi:hypothetical protein [Actinoalloteichus hymeniacidonis]|uniref:Uncharacterized protein n=1 Tax=Actinoalloteichus hymeniacidonis TaxID=340345 RepID=A0AAC9MYI0_9PSEU|nr:hypothetical protein [Actinoalloteichus hymeniacidonis]AOS62926.1 hypothetical protein TL08_10560 [Actinoalloteichus hymeniacidonis]MBB5909041.1 hypothetical protein [Actinoalloteichus hymeniacidonis]
MSRTSLTDQLVALRCQYTGGNASAATPEIVAAVTHLARDERSTLVDVLRAGPDEIGGIRVADSVRHSLLSPAGTPGQRRLDSALLLALTRVGSHLQLRPPADLLRPAQPIRAVRPTTAELIVHLWPDALGPLLFELLPRTGAGHFEGVPGLRYRRRHRSVELVLLGDDLPGRVVLAGVNGRTFRAGLAFASRWATETERGTHSIAEASPDRLDAAERQHLTESPGSDPAGVGSELLRRSGLLSSALWSTSWGRHGQWWWEWAAGPAPRSVRDRLRHPAFGLSDAIQISTPDDAAIATHRGAPHRNGFTVALRTVEAPAHADGARSTGFEWPAEYRAWSDWDARVG